MRRTFYLVYLLAWLLVPSAWAQKEGNNWFFGSGDGLTFNTTPPSSTTGSARDSYENTVMSDECGRLLFYSEGVNIYNRRHQIMRNGANIGPLGGLQGVVSVPYPQHDSVYILFNTTPVSSDPLSRFNLTYSVIDMRLEGGLGEVVARDNFLTGDQVNQMTAVRHANGRDYWLLAVQVAAGATSFDIQQNRLLTFLVNHNGVQREPAVNRVQGVIFAASLFRLRASPDGRKIIVGGFPSDNTGGNAGEGILLDFDNATGRVTRTTLVPGGGFGLDYDFSPNSRKVYAGLADRVYQYQIDRPTGADIAATRTEVPGSRGVWSMRLAPDRKIYIFTTGGPASVSRMDVIDNPDAPAAAAGYRRNAYSFRLSGELPNNLASFTIGKLKDFQARNPCVGQPVAFAPQVNYRVVRWQWGFGDPASGAANESDQESPTHIFSGPGTYRVRMVTSDRCGERDTVLRSVVVYPDPVQNLPDSTEACFSETPVTLSGRDWPLTRHRWTLNGAPTGDTIATVRATRTGWWRLASSNPCATRADSVFVRVFPKLAANIPDDTVFCRGTAALVDGGAAAGPDADLPGTDYLWSTGATSRTVTLADTGTYWVRVRNRCSVVTDTFRLLLVPEDVSAEIPNVFTPDGDGINDTFETRVLNRNYRLTVANRWGGVVFESRQPARQWDGTVNGNPVPPGTYYWRVTAIDCRGAPAEWRGWVQLLR